MEKTYQEIIQETIKELLEKLDFEAQIEVFSQENDQNNFFCKLSVAQNQNFLIGQHGTNLMAIQHIIRIFLSKKIAEKIQITVDVNDYFAEKKMALEKEAREAEEKALQTRVDVILRPMLPYERKVVHAFLSESAYVSTESTGVGESRRIVIHLK